jgi:mono/diheme cytochrome c family protein
VRRLVLLACACVALTGCKTIPPAKPLEQLTAQEHAGYVAFQQNCAQCHNDRETGALHGPSLLAVFRNQYLPSGAPANDERVTNVMLHGRGMMPALGGQLGQDDIANILAYLHTL